MTLRSFSLWVMLGVSGVAGATLADILWNPVRVYVETPAQIQRGYEEAGGKLPRVRGWALYVGSSPDIWGCRVHVPPLTPKTLWIWQHEFKHCTEGSWH